MAMNRTFEFTPSPEEALVSRILVLVHKAVDENFPAIAQANRQFTKTLFSDDTERTAIGSTPDLAPAFAGEEDTASDNRSHPDVKEHPPVPPAPLPTLIPPPPGSPTRASRHEAAANSRPAASANNNNLPPAATTDAGQALSQAPQSQAAARSQQVASRQGTRLDDAMVGIEGKSPDWWTHILIALLIAGGIVFIYAMFL